MSDPKLDVNRSDLDKIHDAMIDAEAFFVHRDSMNAAVHLAGDVRYSPITSRIQAERERLSRILGYE